MTPKSLKCQDIYKEFTILTTPDIHKNSPVRMESGGSIPQSLPSTFSLSGVESGFSNIG